jgi:DNA-binding SARP family transcriptional activator
VDVVGTLVVRLGGRPMAPKDVGSRKARTLLALLAVSAPRPVPVEAVVAAVWGDAPPRRPEQDAATLVSRLRATLGRAAVAGDRAAYRLGDGVRVDLWTAADWVEHAEALVGSDPRAALSRARSAEWVLAGGEVLDDLAGAEWAEAARTARGDLLRRAWHAGAEAALRTGATTLARAAAEAAGRADPLDEAACRLAMRAHAASGEPARALAAFARLRAALADELGVDPAPETRELHVAILRATAAPVPTGPVGPALRPVPVPPTLSGAGARQAVRDRDAARVHRTHRGVADRQPVAGR